MIRAIKPKVAAEPDLRPTEENQHILDLVQSTGDNLLIRALAGTGKTSQLKMIERSMHMPILYIVFNTKNRKEAKEEMLSTTVPHTYNSCGLECWRGAIKGEATTNDKKCREILAQVIAEAPKHTRGELWDVYWDVLAGVSMAKCIGYVPDRWPVERLADQATLIAKLDEQPSDIVLDLIDEVLDRSIHAAYAGALDFNDQVYMPALFGGTYSRFPMVFVDEKQDSNPVNIALLKKLVRGRIVGVGDECQNIYGFRGASPDAMAEAQAHWRMTECTLSVSFRCPERVVEAARWRAPHFKWIKPGGHVEHLKDIRPSDFAEDAAIICRNNAPLFKLGLQLLAHGRSVSVAGSDIGPKLVGIMRKLGPENSPRATVENAIEDWRAERLANESTTANDLADCMRVFAGYGADLGQAIKYLEHLFAQQGTLKLLTGHKSKGLEWDTVYMLDQWLLKPDQQDQNLRYVMQTRSANHLYEVESNYIRWKE